MLRLRWEWPGTSPGAGSFTLSDVMLWIMGCFRTLHTLQDVATVSQSVSRADFSQLSHYVRKDIGMIGTYPTSLDFMLSISYLPFSLSGNPVCSLRCACHSSPLCTSLAEHPAHYLNHWHHHPSLLQHLVECLSH